MCVCDTFAQGDPSERGLMVSWLVMEYAWEAIRAASEDQCLIYGFHNMEHLCHCNAQKHTVISYLALVE